MFCPAYHSWPQNDSFSTDPVILRTHICFIFCGFLCALVSGRLTWIQIYCIGCFAHFYVLFDHFCSSVGNVPFYRSFSNNSPHDYRPSSHSCALLTLFKSELSGSNFQAWVPKSSESIWKHAYSDSWLTLSHLILNAMSHYTRNGVNLLIVLSARPYNQNHTVDIQCLSVVYNLMHNTSIL